jgi:hypothetical protein
LHAKNAIEWLGNLLKYCFRWPLKAIINLLTHCKYRYYLNVPLLIPAGLLWCEVLAQNLQISIKTVRNPIVQYESGR